MPFPSNAVPITGPLGLGSDQETHPTHLDIFGQGGHRSVLTITERDAISSFRRKFGMLVTVVEDNKTYILCNSTMDSTCNNDVTSNGNWKEFSAGGQLPTFEPFRQIYSDSDGALTDEFYTTTRLLDSFPGDDFDEKLRHACSNADNGTIIDCSRYRGTTQNITETVVISKSIKLLFPSMTVVYESIGGVRNHMFWIKASGVTIEGTGRSSKKDLVSTNYANTQFHMLLAQGSTQNGGYHICNENDFPHYDSDLEFTASNKFKIKNKDLSSLLQIGETIRVLNADNSTNNGPYIITGINYISNSNDTEVVVQETTIVPSTTVNTNTNITFQAQIDGYNVITLRGFDCIGVEQIYVDNNTTGVKITTAYGAGGICIIEGNPFVTGGGNAVNQIYIEDVFVWQTRDHAILLIGAILAQVINCRTSNAAGHGFYLGGTCTSQFSSAFTLGGSTSSYFANCYASSSRLAGFCFHSSSYSQIQNCASENSGMGYFLRSAFNISLFGCGAEENNSVEDVPNNLEITFKTQDTLGGVVGGTIGQIYEVTLDDVGSTYRSRYKGSSLYIGGGRNLYIPNFYSMNPAYIANGGTTAVGSQHSTHITIYGNARAVYITNPRLTGDNNNLYNAIRIEKTTQSPTSDAPRDVNLFFNPVEDRPSGTWYESAPDITLTRLTTPPTSCDAIILDQGDNTEIKNGSTYYRPWFYTPNSIYTPTTPYKSLMALDQNDQVFPIVVSENIYIPVEYTVSGIGYEVYSSTSQSSNIRNDALMPTLFGQTKYIIGLSIGYLSINPTSSVTLDIYLSTSAANVVTNTLLYSVTSTSVFPVSVNLSNPVQITGDNWCLKLVTTGIYTVTVGTIGLKTVNY